ncbi:hypothetical protein ACJ41O_003626 [Fusarium nematophilum]
MDQQHRRRRPVPRAASLPDPQGPRPPPESTPEHLRAVERLLSDSPRWPWWWPRWHVWFRLILSVILFFSTSLLLTYRAQHAAAPILVPFHDALRDAVTNLTAGLIAVTLPLFSFVPLGLPQLPQEQYKIQPSQILPSQLWQAIGCEIAVCQAYARSEDAIRNMAAAWRERHDENPPGMLDPERESALRLTLSGLWVSVDSIWSTLKLLDREDGEEGKGKYQNDRDIEGAHLFGNIQAVSASAQEFISPINDTAHQINETILVMNACAEFMRNNSKSYWGEDAEFFNRRLLLLGQYARHALGVYDYSLVSLRAAAINATAISDSIAIAVSKCTRTSCLDLTGFPIYEVEQLLGQLRITVDRFDRYMRWFRNQTKSRTEFEDEMSPSERRRWDKWRKREGKPSLVPFWLWCLLNGTAGVDSQ